jgi:hypothetical protein
MALYINDPEVSRLANQLAKSTGTTKTEIVRRLLQDETKRLERARTADARYEAIMDISRRGGEIMRKHYPNFKYGKKEADEMFAYLDEDASQPEKKPRKKKAS